MTRVRSGSLLSRQLLYRRTRCCECRWDEEAAFPRPQIICGLHTGTNSTARSLRSTSSSSCWSTLPPWTSVADQCDSLRDMEKRLQLAPAKVAGCFQFLHRRAVDQRGVQHLASWRRRADGSSRTAEVPPHRHPDPERAAGLTLRQTGRNEAHGRTSSPPTVAVTNGRPKSAR